jgi:two-component system, OmpR family, sensor histidine kinase KdpD
MTHGSGGAPQPPGRLHIYLGAFPGAGKTHAMLAEGARLAGAGADVVVALVETHGRAGLSEVGAGLEIVPQRSIGYRGSTLAELDTEAVLARHPGVALVDELAHTNVPGSPREKRWQDVAELLRAGIDVVTTVDIQHVSSLRGPAEQIIGARQREFVPEALVLAADRIDFVDTPAAVVLQRLGYGQAGPPASSPPALGGFFRPARLEALRRLAGAWLSEHHLAAVAARPQTPEPEATTMPRPVVVAVAPGAPAGQLVRRAAELAALRGAPLVGVCVRDTSGVGDASSSSEGLEPMLAGFGGRYAEVGGTDIAQELARFAEREQAAVLVIGDTSHSAGRRLVHGSIARRTLRLVGQVEVYIVPPVRSRRAAGPAADEPERAREHVALPARRRLAAWLLAVAAPVALMAALSPARSSIGLSGALVCGLLAVVAVALVGGVAAAIIATAVGVAAADFFFAAPYYSLRVGRLIDVLALVVFAVAGAVVGAMAHVLASRARQTARGHAEAEQLARMVACAVVEPREPAAELAAQLRAAFDLDAVGIMTRAGDGWQVQAVAGGPLPDHPDAAAFAAEIGPGRVLVMSGDALARPSARLLRVLTSELLLARRRAQLETLTPALRNRQPRFADSGQA